MIRNIIIQDYQECVQLAPNIPDEFKRSLKAHERIPVFIDNLCSELEKVKNLTREDIKMSVYNCTEVFMNLAKSKVDQKIVADATAAELNRPKDTQGLDSNGNGFNEELEVIVQDKIT